MFSYRCVWLITPCGGYQSTKQIAGRHAVFSGINPFRSIPDFGILLWPMPDDFTRQGKTSWTGKELTLSMKHKFSIILLKLTPNDFTRPEETSWFSEK